jgi:hypothetical protein
VGEHRECGHQIEVAIGQRQRGAAVVE